MFLLKNNITENLGSGDNKKDGTENPGTVESLGSNDKKNDGTESLGNNDKKNDNDIRNGESLESNDIKHYGTENLGNADYQIQNGEPQSNNAFKSFSFSVGNLLNLQRLFY